MLGQTKQILKVIIKDFSPDKFNRFFGIPGIPPTRWNYGLDNTNPITAKFIMCLEGEAETILATKTGRHKGEIWILNSCEKK